MLQRTPIQPQMPPGMYHPLQMPPVSGLLPPLHPPSLPGLPPSITPMRAPMAALPQTPRAPYPIPPVPPSPMQPPQVHAQAPVSAEHRDFFPCPTMHRPEFPKAQPPFPQPPLVGKVEAQCAVAPTPMTQQPYPPSNQTIATPFPAPQQPGFMAVPPRRVLPTGIIPSLGRALTEKDLIPRTPTPCNFSFLAFLSISMDNQNYHIICFLNHKIFVLAPPPANKQVPAGGNGPRTPSPISKSFDRGVGLGGSTRDRAERDQGNALQISSQPQGKDSLAPVAPDRMGGGPQAWHGEHPENTHNKTSQDSNDDDAMEVGYESDSNC
ncbi:unnamed protein product, partial [Cylicostephanus goldi]